MAEKRLKATANLQIADDGTFNVNLQFQDSDGANASVPAGLSATYTPSDATPGPSVLDLTPSADTSSAAGAIDQAAIKALIASGAPLPTNLQVSIIATWTGLASPQTVVATPPIDVVAGLAQTFVAQESASS